MVEERNQNQSDINKPKINLVEVKLKMNERQKLIADVKQQYAELYKTVHNVIFHIEEDETDDLFRLALAEEEILIYSFIDVFAAIN